MADEKKPENALELDKVDLSALGSDSERKTESPNPERPTAAHHREGVSRKKLIAFISAIGAILICGIAAVVVWQFDLLPIDSPKENKPESIASLQVPLEPIRTSLGQAQSLRISLVFVCRSMEDAEVLRKKRAKLKSIVLISLNKQGVAEIILAGRYQQLRNYLKEEVNTYLNGEYVQEIYFSDILRY